MALFCHSPHWQCTAANKPIAVRLIIRKSTQMANSEHPKLLAV